MFSIARIYTGMMKTSFHPTLNGPAGMATLKFLDLNIRYSVHDPDAFSAKIARRLHTLVHVRVDRGRIERTQRYDLP